VTVKSGASVSFVTGEAIYLQPGFKVEAGGVFHAGIQALPVYDPGSYYNGATPALIPLAGQGQQGWSGQFALTPFEIAVWNLAGTAPYAGAPVLITVDEGSGYLAASGDAGAVLVKSLELTTDAEGVVRAFFKYGSTDSVNVIRVIAGGSSFFYTATSYVDADGDLLADSWEIAFLGGNLGQAGGGDYDDDALSNRDEWVLGCNPGVKASAVSASVIGLAVYTP
jgi:hypothetical protein